MDNKIVQSTPVRLVVSNDTGIHTTQSTELIMTAVCLSPTAQGSRVRVMDV